MHDRSLYNPGTWTRAIFCTAAVFVTHAGQLDPAIYRSLHMSLPLDLVLWQVFKPVLESPDIGTSGAAIALACNNGHVTISRTFSQEPVP